MHEQEILLKLTEIENLLRGKQSDLLNLNQAAQYLSISNSQLYKYTSQRKIPFHKPAGKYLYFFKGELDLWIINNSTPPRDGQELENQNEKLKEVEGGEQKAENQMEMFEEETEPP